MPESTRVIDAPSGTSAPDGAFAPQADAPSAEELEAGRNLEAAGRRVAAYLRRVPMPEPRRHELTLRTLRRLACAPGDDPDAASARAMEILGELMAEHINPPRVCAGPGVTRRHMSHEEMDRRPWVQLFDRLSLPVRAAAAAVFNTEYIFLVELYLMLAVLYALRSQLRP